MLLCIQATSAEIPAKSLSHVHRKYMPLSTELPLRKWGMSECVDSSVTKVVRHSNSYFMAIFYGCTSEAKINHFLWKSRRNNMWEMRLCGLWNAASSPSHFPVNSAKVKFHRWSITLLKNGCLTCLEIWNFKTNRLSLVTQKIYLFEECKPCAQDGQPHSKMQLFRQDLRVTRSNYSFWGPKAIP